MSVGGVEGVCGAAACAALMFKPVPFSHKTIVPRSRVKLRFVKMVVFVEYN